MLTRQAAMMISPPQPKSLLIEQTDRMQRHLLRKGRRSGSGGIMKPTTPFTVLLALFSA